MKNLIGTASDISKAMQHRPQTVARILVALFAMTIIEASTTPVQASLVISDSQTQNVTCGHSTCKGTARNSILNVGDLVNMLSSTDVEVNSGKSKEIEVDAMLSWATAKKLTLASCRSITIGDPVEVTGTGGLTLISNSCGNDGDITFKASGHIEFWDVSSILTINSVSYALEADIGALARAVTKDSSGNYALARNYDASVDGTYKHAPIKTAFSGRFEGLGNTVSNLAINVAVIDTNIGLFAYVSATGSLRDLVLKEASVETKRPSTNVGSAVGVNEGTVIALHSDAVVSASASTNVGGLIGYSHEGFIEYSTASGLVTGGANAGGLVGYDDGAYTYRSSASASVSASTGNAGGLMGQALGGIDQNHGIFGCYATGSVVAGGSYAGGLVGFLRDRTNDDFATGSVTGGDEAGVGGFAGFLYFGVEMFADYARGKASGGANANVGGLVGENMGDILSSYSTSAVSGGAGSAIGGLLGTSTPAQFGSDYWDIDTSGSDQASSEGNWFGTAGLTTSQFKSGLPSGFDPKSWREKVRVNDGYPYLIAYPPPR